jgi:hypothetical protein
MYRSLLAKNLAEMQMAVIKQNTLSLVPMRQRHYIGVTRDKNNYGNPFNAYDNNGQWHREIFCQFCSNKFFATRICPSLCLPEDQIIASAEPPKPVKQEVLAHITSAKSMGNFPKEEQAYKRVVNLNPNENVKGLPIPQNAIVYAEPVLVENLEGLTLNAALTKFLKEKTNLANLAYNKDPNKHNEN